MTRYLITGGRDYKDRVLVFRTLDDLTIDEGDMLPRDGTLIIHGDCPTGADQFADDWAIVNWTPVERYPATWALGKAAGILRNERMLRDGKPDMVIAFPGGAGTNDMMRRARRAGVEVRRFGWPE